MSGAQLAARDAGNRLEGGIAAGNSGDLWVGRMSLVERPEGFHRIRDARGGLWRVVEGNASGRWREVSIASAWMQASGRAAESSASY